MLSAFTVILLVACGALSLGLNHYRDNAIAYKEQRDKKARTRELAHPTITKIQGPPPGFGPPGQKTPGD
ncbi:hypothetical protein ACISSW_28050, partial [Escherichia coli]